MRKNKTIHTQADAPKMLTVSFGAALIAHIGKDAPTSGSVDFHCLLGRGFEKLFERMGWQVPADKTTRQNLEGKLEGGHFVLTSKDKLVEAEVQIQFKTLSNFHVLRLELEGKKGKGFRRELRFRFTTEQLDAIGILEGYMTETDNARGSLSVKYMDAPIEVQSEIGDQPMLDEVRADATSESND